MGWMLAVMLLIVGALTGDLLLAVEIVVIMTVGVQVVKWGDRQFAKEKEERLRNAKSRRT